jgi:hypothetical protein
MDSKTWLLSVWITLPIVKFGNEGRKHVLLSSTNGKCIYLMADETGSRLGSIDEKTGLFVDSGYDLTNYRKGWHHIAV